MSSQGQWGAICLFLLPCHPSRTPLRAFHTVAWPSYLEPEVRKMLGLCSAGEELSLWGGTVFAKPPQVSELRASDTAFHPAGPSKNIITTKHESK